MREKRVVTENLKQLFENIKNCDKLKEEGYLEDFHIDDEDLWFRHNWDWDGDDPKYWSKDACEIKYDLENILEPLLILHDAAFSWMDFEVEHDYMYITIIEKAGNTDWKFGG